MNKTLLNEINSVDGTISAKIFGNSINDLTYSDFFVEKWINGQLQGSMNLKNYRYEDARRSAQQWVSSVRTLNG